MPAAISEEKHAEIVRLATELRNFDAVAKRTGVSSSTVKKYARAAEITTARASLTEEQRNQLAQDVRDGMSIDDAAKKYGIVRSSALTITQRRKVHLKRLPLTQEEEGKVLAALRRCPDAAKVARRLRKQKLYVSRSQVWRIADKAGIVLNRRHLSKTERSDIAASLRAFPHATAASEEHGVSQQTVSAIAKDIGIELPGKMRLPKAPPRHRKPRSSLNVPDSFIFHIL